MGFSNSHYWTPKIKDGWNPPSWKSTWRHFFFWRGWSDLDKILETGAEWYVDCGDVVEFETRHKIPIWQTFGRIQWHVIQEPPAPLQGAATWRIQCHDSRATCHILKGGATMQIQWHVIPEPRITLQGAATWWIHCHDSRATCHIAGCKNIDNRFSPYSIFFVFIMQFRLWRAAAFVSSPIHLLLL